MSQLQLLNLVVCRLATLGIPSMLTGSLASSLQGEPRSTHDVDLLIDMNLSQVDPFMELFSPPEFYLGKSAVQEAIQQRRMFNLLNLENGDKVDFWLVTDDPFDQCRFHCRRQTNIGSTAVDVSTPEDTILMKLKSSVASGGSEKQFHDAIRVYELQAAQLDMSYMESWLSALKIRGIWNRLLSEADPIA